MADPFNGNYPVPEDKPYNSNTGFGWLDSLLNTAAGVAASYWQYDTAQSYGQWQAQQNAALAANAPESATYGTTAVNSNQLLTYGLLALGAVLVLKAVK